MKIKWVGEPEKFGEYIVHEQLGVGGMATVHRAVKKGIEGFEREVALKRLLPHLAADDKFVTSFVREARLASLLQHTNVIQIYDLGKESDGYFIAMEYVRGFDLRQILRQTAYSTGPMPIPIMLALLGQLCDALEYAHHAKDPQTGDHLGIVHRDISPSNALVSTSGHLKVIDFGVAKARTESLATNSGRLKGKFSYMAPETLLGTELDGRSDIFSVGVMAWELITARPLFSAHRDFDAIKAIRKQEVSRPSRYNPECPKELDEVILLALVKERDRRWQSAGALRNALDTIALTLSERASYRDTSEWMEWLFKQPAAGDKKKPAPRPPSSKPPSVAPTEVLAPRKARALTDDEIASIEIMWPQGRDEKQTSPPTVAEKSKPKAASKNVIAPSKPAPSHLAKSLDAKRASTEDETILYAEANKSAQVKEAISKYQDMVSSEAPAAPVTAEVPAMSSPKSVVMEVPEKGTSILTVIGTVALLAAIAAAIYFFLYMN